MDEKKYSIRLDIINHLHKISELRDKNTRNDNCYYPFKTLHITQNIPNNSNNINETDMIETIQKISVKNNKIDNDDLELLIKVSDNDKLKTILLINFENSLELKNQFENLMEKCNNYRLNEKLQNLSQQMKNANKTLADFESKNPGYGISDFIYGFVYSLERDIINNAKFYKYNKLIPWYDICELAYHKYESSQSDTDISNMNKKNDPDYQYYNKTLNENKEKIITEFKSFSTHIDKWIKNPSYVNPYSKKLIDCMIELRHKSSMKILINNLKLLPKFDNNNIVGILYGLVICGECVKKLKSDYKEQLKAFSTVRDSILHEIKLYRFLNNEEKRMQLLEYINKFIQNDILAICDLLSKNQKIDNLDNIISICNLLENTDKDLKNEWEIITNKLWELFNELKESLENDPEAIKEILSKMPHAIISRKKKKELVKNENIRLILSTIEDKIKKITIGTPIKYRSKKRPPANTSLITIFSEIDDNFLKSLFMKRDEWCENLDELFTNSDKNNKWFEYLKERNNKKNQNNNKSSNETQLDELKYILNNFYEIHIRKEVFDLSKINNIEKYYAALLTFILARDKAKEIIKNNIIDNPAFTTINILDIHPPNPNEAQEPHDIPKIQVNILSYIKKLLKIYITNCNKIAHQTKSITVTQTGKQYKLISYIAESKELLYQIEKFTTIHL